MRHHIAGNRLGRNSVLRKATIRDLAKAALIRQRICTTKSMAKEARKLIDRLITLGKKGDLACRRRAFSVLGDHALVSRLFGMIAVRFKSRNGGYTRIIPLSTRRGDNAHMVFLELTEKDQVIITKTKSEAQAKPKDTVKETQRPARPAAQEAKKEQQLVLPEPGKKAEPLRAHPKDEVRTPDKIKSIPRIMGGIKNFLRKRPPSGSGS